MSIDDIMRSRTALEEFEENNPKIFQADGEVKFSALITWIVSNQEPYIDNGMLVRWNNKPDDSGLIIIDEPDGFGEWEEFWRFHYDINHRCKYDPSANTLSIKDRRGYVEVIIEYDLSVIELLAIQRKVN